MNIDPTWLAAFDREMKQLYAIDHVDAGLSATELARYADLDPCEAALRFGDDYDLEQVDRGWL